MSVIDTVLGHTLAAYAHELLDAGFRVYLPTSEISRVRDGGRPNVGRFFRFSREVDGRECYGVVQRELLETYSFSMPIRPSVQHGSSMWIDGPQIDALTVATAKRYASPTGRNPLVGTHENYLDPRFPNLYTEVTA